MYIEYTTLRINSKEFRDRLTRLHEMLKELDDLLSNTPLFYPHGSAMFAYYDLMHYFNLHHRHKPDMDLTTIELHDGEYREKISVLWDLFRKANEYADSADLRKRLTEAVVICNKLRYVKQAKPEDTAKKQAKPEDTAKEGAGR